MTSKTIHIGVAGVALNNANLGCQALAYSAIKMLESVAQTIGASFHYSIFDCGYDRRKSGAATSRIYEKDGANAGSIDSLREVGQVQPIGAVRHPRAALARRKMVDKLHSIDVLFDLTQGDSFTDMYDDGHRLITYAHTRDAAFEMGIPVILGPQTIGPFETESGVEIARRTLRNAGLVIARDELSSACAKQVAGLDVPVTTDLAFGLPYDHEARLESSHVRVGINPSGLLVKDAFEGGLDTSGFKTDYDDYLAGLCEWLERQTNWEVHLISHVIGGDSPVCRRIKAEHPRFVLHDDFDNPVDAKTLISTMDVFLGSRMHATIAALSSGVPVVPVAYSRKFSGLFGSVDYDVCIDLRTMSTGDALRKTKRLMANYRDLKFKVDHSREKANELLDETRGILAGYLMQLMQGAK